MVNINEIISNYIVSNVEKEVLVKRIATIIEKYEDIRDVLLNGIITDVKVIDSDALLRYVSERIKKSKSLKEYKVYDIKLKSEFRHICVHYSLNAKRYAKNQDETYWYNCTDEKRQDYFEVEVSKSDSFTCDIEDLNGIVEAVVL